MWEKKMGKTMIGDVGMEKGEVLERGDLEVEGVTFGGAEVEIELVDRGEGEGSMLGRGNVVEEVEVGEIGGVKGSWGDKKERGLFLRVYLGVNRQRW
ncbi:PrpF domain-containing protein, partial [Neisseria sicca]|uniref:PrpF domain-containing protein n=1 Tax=Neisseria sicca TaxID=490 RepID=UPI0028FC2BF7